MERVRCEIGGRPGTVDPLPCCRIEFAARLKIQNPQSFADSGPPCGCATFRALRADAAPYRRAARQVKAAAFRTDSSRAFETGAWFSITQGPCSCTAGGDTSLGVRAGAT